MRVDRSGKPRIEEAKMTMNVLSGETLAVIRVINALVSALDNAAGANFLREAISKSLGEDIEEARAYAKATGKDEDTFTQALTRIKAELADEDSRS